MRDLKELRGELDSLDRELVQLFERRMGISREVAAYKIAHQMQVLDASREEQVLASRAALVEGDTMQAAVRTLFTEIMALSREEQQRLLKEEGIEC